MKVTKVFILLITPILFLGNAFFADAAPLFYVSDILGTSAPGATSTHTLQFTTNSAIPPGGKIVFTPDDGDFDIPAGMSYIDIDFQYAPTTTNQFTDRPVGTTTSATADAVSFVTGTSGSITLEMNSTAGVDPGVQVRILVGDHAIYDSLYASSTATTSGVANITNPSTTTTYFIDYQTLTAADAIIDSGRTMVVILEQVGVGPADTTETDPPVITNAQPQGEIANSNTQVEISLNTDELAICRYSTTAGVDYDSMTDDFPTTGQITHAGLIVSGLVFGTTYQYFVRCEDDEGNQNPDDFLIEFFLAPPPGTGGSGPGSGGGQGGEGNNDQGGGSGGGGGGGSGGAPFPPDTASVSFEGIAFPLSTLVILQDGTVARQITLGSDGTFDTTITNIPHGTYTFGIYAIDEDGTKSSTFNSTFSLVGGTGSTLSDIFIAPTLILDAERVEPGGILGISGTGLPNSTVHIWTHQQKSPINDAEITKIEATPDEDGRWSSVINTTGFLRDTYQVKVKSVFSNGDESFFSDFQFYGVGVDPNPINLLSADLNRDGFVNIIDFSILLFHWGTDGGDADPPPDINQDGTVSLTDFSIMLFQWTG